MRNLFRHWIILPTTLLWLALGATANAGEVTVAVASNFLTTVQKLADGFTEQTGHDVRIVNGSTGTLYAQIIKAAPYDVFLSADQKRVLLLAEAGKLHNGAHKPYAVGMLVLYARDTGVLGSDLISSLTTENLRHFAMADPATAPYGQAAGQVLARLEMSEQVMQKAVMGANIGQTFGFVKTGNAQIGFVALSQAKSAGGAWLDIPADYYGPIVQEAGLLAHAKGNPAAQEFYDYLSSDAAHLSLQTAGYRIAQ